MAWLVALATSLTAAAAPVRIGSKAFTESVILGEILAELVRREGGEAVHRRELGGSPILWRAVRSGEIDAYVEYSGTLT
jgi:osmoprotectant transport system permease protein